MAKIVSMRNNKLKRLGLGGQRSMLCKSVNYIQTIWHFLPQTFLHAVCSLSIWVYRDFLDFKLLALLAGTRRLLHICKCIIGNGLLARFIFQVQNDDFILVTILIIQWIFKLIQMAGLFIHFRNEKNQRWLQKGRKQAYISYRKIVNIFRGRGKSVEVFIQNSMKREEEVYNNSRVKNIQILYKQNFWHNKNLCLFRKKLLQIAKNLIQKLLECAPLINSWTNSEYGYDIPMFWFDVGMIQSTW